MKSRSIRRHGLLAVTLSVAALAPPLVARAQWELWVGAWPITFFGICGGVGCFTGQHLCAIFDSSSGTTYCYES
ncbi:MAG: hypothetical protein ACREOG_20430 [Gemmatimonadaceae bacterium]